jgi:hypothetical protein
LASGAGCCRVAEQPPSAAHASAATKKYLETVSFFCMPMLLSSTENLDVRCAGTDS